MFVALIVRVDSYCHIAQHGFWSRGGDYDFADFIQCRVSNLPQLPFFVFMLNFNVGEAGLVFGAIINDPLAAVNEPVIPHFFECLIYCGDDFIVQCKGQMLPRGADAQSSQLQLHIAAFFFNKFPNLIVQLFT